MAPLYWLGSLEMCVAWHQNPNLSLCSLNQNLGNGTHNIDH